MFEYVCGWWVISKDGSSWDVGRLGDNRDHKQSQLTSGVANSKWRGASGKIALDIEKILWSVLEDGGRFAGYTALVVQKVVVYREGGKAGSELANEGGIERGGAGALWLACARLSRGASIGKQLPLEFTASHEGMPLAVSESIQPSPVQR